MNDLEKVFLSELKDIYDCEHQLVTALGKMEESAESRELKDAFHEHCEQTKMHVNRLERVFSGIGEDPKRKSCKGIEGIIDEGEVLAKEFEGNAALDAALIAGGQKAEHYEITSYGSLCAWAKELGKTNALSLLEENLNEEKETDQKLTRLGERARNPEASRHDTKKHSETASKLGKVLSSGG